MLWNLNPKRMLPDRIIITEAGNGARRSNSSSSSPDGEPGNVNVADSFNDVVLILRRLRRLALRFNCQRYLRVLYRTRYSHPPEKEQDPLRAHFSTLLQIPGHTFSRKISTLFLINIQNSHPISHNLRE
jgi:hypothetical protein